MSRKCSKELYCQFLISASNNFTATNFAAIANDLAHDSMSRFLAGTKLTPKVIWEYAKPFVQLTNGCLICDDTVLDHWYGEKIGLAKWQYSGTHHRVVHGIGLTTLLWTASNDEHIPVDFRVYAKLEDGKTKNEHFREMLALARHKGFKPKYILMDSWYSAVDTLRLLKDYHWLFVCGLQSNRTVALGVGKINHLPLKNLSIPAEGRIVHLKEYGLIKIFRFVAKTGKTEYLATNDFSLTSQDSQKVASRRWKVEEYHRGLKQTTGLEACQSRTKRSQRTHIFCSILSFLALEKKRLEDNITWYESKRSIIADSLFSYLKNPFIKLPIPAG